jgi:uncharacterized protein (TIGR03118 family)
MNMTNPIRNKVTTGAKLKLRGLELLIAAGLLTMACLSSSAKEARYRQVNLVSDLPDVAILQDTNLVNAWGVSFSATSPFWISDNGSGLTTLYAVTNDSSGAVQVIKQGLEVTIPGEGNPTGQVFNNLGGFNGDIFLFVSEDGTISGWRSALGTTAEVLTNRAGAIYKGVALASGPGEPALLAANFSEGTIDVYGTNSALIGQFSDPDAPEGYAPFNVQSVDGMVFVTFARQDQEGKDDVAGRGHGLIDLFDPQTGAFHRFATGSDAGGKLKEINSPWGVALAPGTFGEHAGELLVGNFGSGTIMAFDASGEFQRSPLETAAGREFRTPFISQPVRMMKAMVYSEALNRSKVTEIYWSISAFSSTTGSISRSGYFRGDRRHRRSCCIQQVSSLFKHSQVYPKRLFYFFELDNFQAGHGPLF